MKNYIFDLIFPFFRGNFFHLFNLFQTSLSCWRPFLSVWWSLVVYLSIKVNNTRLVGSSCLCLCLSALDFTYRVIWLVSLSCSWVLVVRSFLLGWSDFPERSLYLPARYKPGCQPFEYRLREQGLDSQQSACK